MTKNETIISIISKFEECKRDGTDYFDEKLTAKECDIIIEALQFLKNSSDSISRQDAIDAMANALWHYPNDGYRNLNEYKFARGLAEFGLKSVPSAEPERMKGKWIQNDNGTYSCSLCQAWIPKEQHYYARFCLYCGADMKGEYDE